MEFGEALVLREYLSKFVVQKRADQNGPPVFAFVIKRPLSSGEAKTGV
jgi:hypothetical protein